MIHKFLKIGKWIFLSFYADLSNLLYGFVKVFTVISPCPCPCLSPPLPNRTKLKFDQCFEPLDLLEGLNKAERLNALGHCAFGNNFNQKQVSWSPSQYENIPKNSARIQKMIVNTRKSWFWYPTHNIGATVGRM